MRAKIFLLGVLGGATGLAVHAVLLVRFFSQTSGAFHVFLQLTLAAALGLAAILVAALLRRSTRALAILLPVLGVLGFFPRPLSWAPAGAMLVAAGLVTAYCLWSDGRGPAASHHVQSPSGAPVHWSEAARLGLPAVPPRPAATRGSGSWSSAQKAGVIAAVALAAVVVIPLSLWSPWATAAESEPRQQIATDSSTPTTALSSSTTTSTSEPDDAATTTTLPSTTSTAPAEPGVLAPYSDGQRGFVMSYPTAWRNTKPSEVRGRDFGSQARREREEYMDAYVAAAFADWNGPTFDGCYLDYVWVEVIDDAEFEVAQLSELRARMEDWVTAAANDYPEANVQVIERMHEVSIAGVPACKQIWSFFYGGYTMVVTECAFVAGGSVYYLDLTTVEDDRDANAPLFDQILKDFQVTESSDLI